MNSLFMMLKKWDGVYCALWTPTDSEGRLLEDALKNNLRFLIENGVYGLLPLGSTGQFLFFDTAARKNILEKIMAHAGPLQVMVNISDIRPSAVADLGRHAHQCGAAAISLLPPYFYPLAQEDLIEFFVRAAEAAKLPLFLYNFPERTGNRIGLETIAAVADRVPVAGIKQSGSEFAYHAELAQLGRERGFIVLTGGDTRLPESVPLGVQGCVSGLSNAVPELVVQSLSNARQGAGQLNVAGMRMTEIAKYLSKVTFPLDVAACMQARGRQVGSTKILMSSATQVRFDTLVRDFRSLFKEWNLV